MKKPSHTTIHDWLSDQGSFMQRLKRHGILDAKVRVLQEGFQMPYPDERQLLAILPRKMAWVREVVIFDKKNLFMFARAVFPLETLTGKEKQLQCLKNKSLGSFLFKDPHLIRSPFQISSLSPNTFWYDKVANIFKSSEKSFWARRSMFYTHGKKILLTEFFSPKIGCLL